MKRQLSLFSILLLVAALLATSNVQAKDNNIYMNNAYWKGGNTFDVVVKETPGLKMKLYVNDHNPVTTTVNNEGWATFTKVSMSGTGKISFTWIDNQENEHPIDYTSKFAVSDPKATFTDNNPEPITKSEPAPNPAPQAQPAPVQSTEPAVYYKNCTAARNAGVTPIHRGEPGYASHLDRDNDGIACE